jgi:hypothetical protein
VSSDELWALHEVGLRPNGVKRVLHPEVGLLELQSVGSPAELEREGQSFRGAHDPCLRQGV